ncbi:MAG: glycosyltransferase [Bacteroidales bacterium]|nr:glycosyltransferase [Bacteroidales bacterium]
MISVCIPIHNYDVRPLVSVLMQRAASSAAEVEIVCIDDGSEDKFVDMNRSIEKEAKYVVLGENVGRAKVRNLFLEQAKGDWLLFLDDDCMVIPDRFFEKYTEHLDREYEVLVGGSTYDDSFKDREHRMRWMYGKQVESKRDAESRNREPYLSFMTNNFMIQRRVFEKIRFDERIKGYGHEDTLFGFRLKQAGTKMLHIDNAVVNGDIDTNEQFLQKTKESIKNLAKIRQFLNEPTFDDSVRLLRAYRKAEKLRIAWTIKVWHHLTKRCIEKRFRSGQGFTLTLFNLYKLGEFVDCLNA